MWVISAHVYGVLARDDVAGYDNNIHYNILKISIK